VRNRYKLSSKKIDIINVALIFVSLFLAFRLPFELFLFSYAVLGPLHYLTELNWLKEKNYFISDRKWIWVFIVLSLLISIPVFLDLPAFSIYREHGFVRALAKLIRNFFNEIILILFLFAIGLVYLKNRKYILLYFLGSVVSSILVLKYISFPVIMIIVFLPTLIHVYLFTLLFMIFGSLNTKSKVGILGSIFLLLCPIIIFNIRIDPSYYLASESANTYYLASKFSRVGSYVTHILRPFETGKFNLLSEMGIKIRIFIAFCYTYHYLNWFSKTSVIGWSKTLSKSKLTIILVLWSGSVFLYWYDYKTGFIVLFFLSILHVVLEFPLNVTSIKGIVSKVKFPLKALEASK